MGRRVPPRALPGCATHLDEWANDLSGIRAVIRGEVPLSSAIARAYRLS